MALIKCAECGGTVSDKAATCPACGVKVHVPAARWPWVVFPILILLGVFTLVNVARTPSAAEEEKTKRRRMIELCTQDMNDPMRSAAHREVARAFCERERDEYIRTYGTRP